jgi:hypothetical protein
MKHIVTVAVTSLCISLSCSSAFAQEPTWNQEHPRRAEVNSRLANQNARIKQQVKEGDMSKAQAAQMHQQDHAIRQEERAMASTNKGHITKAEQKALNQQENQVSKEIGK